MGWLLGAVVATATAVGFILIATVSLAGVREDFAEPLGVPALVLEIGFLATAALRLNRARRAAFAAPLPARRNVRRPHPNPPSGWSLRSR